MSEHEERALAEAYALGSLDPPERKLFEAHLVSCKICREAVRSAGVVVQAIALTAPKESPPKGSGDRLVALFNKEKGMWTPPPARGSGLGGTLAVAFALLALGVSGWGYYEHERFEKAQAALEECHKRNILDAPDMRSITLVPQGGFKGKATVVAYSPSRGVAVIGDGLPAPAPGKCYKLWSIADAGPDPVKPMGAFQPGVFLDRSPGGTGTKFAITEETDPNVKTGTLMVLAPG